MARLPHWWAWKMHRGHPVIRGPSNSEQEAYREGMAYLGGDFEVVMLYTIDRNFAKHKIADIVLSRSKNLDLALAQARYQPIKGTGKGEG